MFCVDVPLHAASGLFMFTLPPKRGTTRKQKLIRKSQYGGRWAVPGVWIGKYYRRLEIGRQEQASVGSCPAFFTIGVIRGVSPNGDDAKFPFPSPPLSLSFPLPPLPGVWAEPPVARVRGASTKEEIEIGFGTCNLAHFCFKTTAYPVFHFLWTKTDATRKCTLWRCKSTPTPKAKLLWMT